MPFVFGETPAQAGVMGYNIADRNRAAQIAAQDNEARYAMDANNQANARAFQFAQVQDQRQQYANSLAAQEATNQENRYRFGLDQQARQRGEDWIKYTFGKGQEQNKALMDLKREQVGEQKQKQDDEVANIGGGLAEALSQLQPSYDTSLARLNKATEKLDRIKRSAVEIGLVLNPKTGSFSTANPAMPPETIASWTTDYADWKKELDDATKELPALQREIDIQRRQARSSGFAVEPTGVRHLRTGSWFPQTAPQPPQTVPISLPTAAQTTNFRRGTRAIQNGLTYEFDGAIWNPIP